MRNKADVKIWGLGEFFVEYQGDIIRESDWHSQNALKLFKYLLLDPERVKKDEILIDIFWPDYDFSRGKKRLYDTIYQLRKMFDREVSSFDDSIIIKISKGYMLNNSWDYWFDWQEFAGLYWKINYEIKNDSSGVYDEVVPIIENALKLYRDDFFSGDRYETWTEVAREQYREMYLDLLLAIANSLYHNNQGVSALDYLKKGIREEPYREDFYLLAMRILQKENRLAEAVKMYDKCYNLLKNDLNIAPSSELQKEYKDICSNNFSFDDDLFAKFIQTNESDTAFICNREIFITVLELEKRHVERADSVSLFLKIKFKDNFPDFFIQKLIKEIAGLLRKDDVLSQWSNDKIYIILNKTSHEDKDIIESRIKELGIWQTVDEIASFDWLEITAEEKNQLKIVNNRLEI